MIRLITAASQAALGIPLLASPLSHLSGQTLPDEEEAAHQAASCIIDPQRVLNSLNRVTQPEWRSGYRVLAKKPLG